MVARLVTPDAVAVLHRVTLHGSREVPALQAPVYARHPALLEPLFGSSGTTRGYLTGRDSFSCGMRILGPGSSKPGTIETLAAMGSPKLQLSCVPTPRLNFLSYALFKTGIRPEDLYDTLLRLHQAAYMAFSARERGLGIARPGADAPAFTTIHADVFARDVLLSLRAF